MRYANLILLGFIISCISVGVSAQSLDIKLLRDINLNRNKKCDPAFRTITHSMGPVIIVTPITLLGTGYFIEDRTMKCNAVVMGASLLTTALITGTLKYTIKRPRPFVTYPDIEKATNVRDPSFPSGHSSGAFALATSVSLAYPKWYVIVPSYTWAFAVAWSRMHLGVHYPSDVLVGMLIGIGSFFLCYQINNKFYSNSH
jgi:membrane-associated phospholipid phosphatase